VRSVFGPGSVGSYWTATPFAGTSTWVVSFGDGYVLVSNRSNSDFVRAVRGGL